MRAIGNPHDPIAVTMQKEIVGKDQVANFQQYRLCPDIQIFLINARQTHGLENLEG